jgi:hypothetical protein
MIKVMQINKTALEYIILITNKKNKSEKKEEGNLL